MQMRLRCCREFFSLDELMARELMVPRTDAFMVDIAATRPRAFPERPRPPPSAAA